MLFLFRIVSKAIFSLAHVFEVVNRRYRSLVAFRTEKY